MSFEKLERVLLDIVPVNNEQKQILQRRLNKLKRDPIGFIEGSYAKRKDQVRKYLPIKYDGKYHYTVVSAVYNSEKYLDDYFESIVNQTLNFKKYIQLILVDDGSTDASADIIKKWQKKYPNNIHYYYKENGGQASARNIGLKHVKTEWVTFIDSDDFLDLDYFFLVDQQVSLNQDIVMVCCNQIYYFEETDQYIDRHPFGYRFKNGISTAPCGDLGRNIHFSAALSVIKVECIPSWLNFDEKLKPTFEDGKFVNMFLLKQDARSLVCYHPNARYYNRKRADKSSTMDGIWQHKGQFTTVFEYGYLDILSNCKQEIGYIPRHLQRTILWEMLKLVKQFLNHEERLNLLSAKEKENLLINMDKVFEYIDKDTIMSYELGNCGFSRQLGMLGCFKNMDVDRQVAYIDQVDYSSNLFSMRFFTAVESSFQVRDKNASQEILPVYYKKARRDFIGRTFLIEHRLWLPIPNTETIINLIINGKSSFINFNKQKFKTGFPSLKLKENFAFKKPECWVLMDRDDSAGDNAEFLYEYLQNHHPALEVYFVLNQSSVDWERLANKGFKLIDHGSFEHKKILEKCTKLISSQIGYIVEPFEYLRNDYRTVFLQHGVIKDDLSEWLNGVKMDLMLTSSTNEYHSIVDNFTKYIYGKKEIALTGLPRFDSLYRKKDDYKDQILIMFTWRKSITGTFVENGKSERHINSDFRQTQYYIAIDNLLNDESFKNLTHLNGVDVVFCPHPNMRPYLKFFSIPNHVKIADDSTPIHDLINDSKILITDFSSVAFDFAFQKKPVIYYQFDQEDFFQGEHTYTQGYFSYEEHGFGPVVTEPESLIKEMEAILHQSNAEEMKMYRSRIDATFPFFDDLNCHRVYQSICQLDTAKENKFDTGVLKMLIDSSYSAKDWDVVIQRSKTYLDVYPEDGNVQTILLDALVERQNWKEIEDLLESSDIVMNPGQSIKFNSAKGKWKDVISDFNKCEVNFDSTYLNLQALFKLEKLDQAEKLLHKLLSGDGLLHEQKLLIRLLFLEAKQDYEGIISLADAINKLPLDILREFMPQILLAKSYRLMGMLESAHQQLVNFESHTRNNIFCRKEILELAFANRNYKKYIIQYNRLLEDLLTPTDDQKYKYMISLYAAGDYDKYASEFEVGYDSNIELKILYVKALTHLLDWQRALDTIHSNGLAENSELIYEFVLSQYRLGLLDQAYQAIKQPTKEDTYKYWALVAELSFLMEDFNLSKYCYRGMISIFPNHNKDKTLKSFSEILKICEVNKYE